MLRTPRVIGATTGKGVVRVPRYFASTAKRCHSSWGAYRQASRGGVAVASSRQYDCLQDATAYSSATGVQATLGDILAQEECTLVACLTHFADLSSWELAGQLMKLKPALDRAGVQLVILGLGSVSNSMAFTQYLGDDLGTFIPPESLYALPDATLYRRLGYSQGFGAGMDNVDPYLKLLPMLMGIGSPGTVAEVARGYLGDREAEPVFAPDTPLGNAFGILGSAYQRPFELATLRLLNMSSILPRWGELCPPDTTLLTQQGGCVLLRGEDVLFEHVDSGILKFADTRQILAAVEQYSRSRTAAPRRSQAPPTDRAASGTSQPESKAAAAPPSEKQATGTQVAVKPVETPQVLRVEEPKKAPSPPTAEGAIKPEPPQGGEGA